MFDWHSAQAAVDAVSGERTLRVVAELAQGPYGHNALARATDLNHRTLTRRLKRLEHAGMVTRDVHGYRPFRVQYQLTLRAEALLETFHELAHKWNASAS